MQIAFLGMIIWCNAQWAGIAIPEPYYRSWTVTYSYGQSLGKEGKWVNHWKRPTFSHVDMREFMHGKQ